MKTSKQFIHILALATLLVCTPKWQQVYAQEYSGAIAESRKAMQELVADGGTPGAAIAVAVGGKLVWTEGFGYANIAQKKAATADTQFGIGSVSKALTAALFGRMVEKGKVAWDTPVQKYLPDFPHEDVTARMIAGHTSGLGDNFDNANRLTTRHFETQEALAEILKEPLRHQPGTKYYYGTSSFTVLAAVLEKVTGRTFSELMAEELLAPLGMKSTIVNDGGKRANPHRTVFYRNDQGGLEVIPEYDPSFKLAGAGYISTAADLARFGAAMLGGPGAVSDKVRAEVFRAVKLNDGTQPMSGVGEHMGVQDEGVGLGWSIGRDKHGRRVIHQPGGGPGISSCLVLYPDQSVVVAILSNQTSAPLGGEPLAITTEAFLKQATGTSASSR